jgi:hypothetical protein
MRPTTFRDWSHALTRLRLVFRTSADRNKARAFRTPILIYDGVTYERSTIIIRITF